MPLAVLCKAVKLTSTILNYGPNISDILPDKTKK